MTHLSHCCPHIRWLSGFFSLFFLCLVLFTACEGDPKDPELPSGLAGVFLLNQGNFGSRNSSLSFHKNELDSTFNKVFRKTNGRKLGDASNQMVIEGNLLFVVVTGSNRIEVMSVDDFKSVTTIEGFRQPRHIEILDAGRAYVTNSADSSLDILDLQNYTILGTLKLSTNPEGVKVFGGHAFVCGGGLGLGNVVWVIDLAADTVVATISTLFQPISLAIDEGDGEVYVCCAGRLDSAVSGGIVVIDGSTFAVRDTLSSLTGANPVSISIVDSIGIFVKDFGGEVVVFETKGNSAFANYPGNFEAAGIGPGLNRFFLLDQGDFIGRGTVTIVTSFGPDSTAKNIHEIGVNPVFIAISE